MSLDAEAITVAQDGHIFIGDADTDEPTFLDTPDPTLWAEFGYVTSDGATFNAGLETTDLDAWQARSAVRTLVTNEPLTVAFVAIEFRPSVISVAMRGGTLTDTGSGTAARWTPPSPGVNPVRALYITATDEDSNFAYYIPRAQVNGAAEWVLQKAAESQIPLAFNLLDPDDGERIAITSDHPAWLAELAGSSS